MPRSGLIIAAALVTAALGRPAAAEMNCSEDTFCLLTEAKGDTTTFSAINKNPHLPLTVQLHLSLQNLEVRNGVNEAIVVQGGEKRLLFALAPKQPDDAWEYSYEYAWVAGDFRAQHRPDHAYRLPYKVGRTYAVSQSCNGSFSHTGHGKYAIDFDMPIGTPILAARAGTVVDIKQDSTRGGEDERFENDGNYVTVLHDDATLAHYFHLHPNTVEVALGQQVTAGDLLGQAGNTGFSSGPHLHFEVVTVHLNDDPKDGPTQISVPITFEAQRGKVTCPADGVRLRVK